MQFCRNFLFFYLRILRTGLCLLSVVFFVVFATTALFADNKKTEDNLPSRSNSIPVENMDELALKLQNKFSKSLKSEHPSNQMIAKQKIKIGANPNHIPYVLAASDSGIMLDRINDICKKNNILCTYNYYSNTRLAKELGLGELDCVVNVPLALMEQNKLKVFSTKALAHFDNVFIHLKKNAFELKKISDLQNFKILAFQGAKFSLGSEFLIMANKNPNYKEIGQQQAQVMALYSERADIIVSDRRIFQYQLDAIKNKKLSSIDFKKEIQIVSLLPVFARSLICRTQEMTEFFNKFL